MKRTTFLKGIAARVVHRRELPSSLATTIARDWRHGEIVSGRTESIDSAEEHVASEKRRAHFFLLREDERPATAQARSAVSRW